MRFAKGSYQNYMNILSVPSVQEDMSEDAVRTKFELISDVLDERARRLWAAAEALVLGRGGIKVVSAATGMSRTTIWAGMRELRSRERTPTPAKGARRVRAPGAGRKGTEEKYPEIAKVLDRLVDPATRGEPDSPLRWTSKSTRHLAQELTKLGFPVSPMTISRMLRKMDYSLQAASKVREGKKHPDRDQQFEHINQQAQRFLDAGQPVISVDTKKKELVGCYHNGGVEWHRKCAPEQVNDHDFPDPEVPKAIPYGVYDVGSNRGMVNVGTDHDTPEFAVQSIRTWWEQMGKEAYPDASELMVTADAGGSNGYRVRTWKTNLQILAKETGLRISVCHLPPGTSKWNKIEHRMFCHITKNWRGRPLESYDTVVNLIGATTTSKGLRIKAKIDDRSYKTGVRVSDKEFARVPIEKSAFHGEWNYSILPSGS